MGTKLLWKLFRLFRKLILLNTVEIKLDAKGGQEEKEKEKEKEEEEKEEEIEEWISRHRRRCTCNIEYTAEILRRKDKAERKRERESGYLNMRSHGHPVSGVSWVHNATCQWEVRYQRARGASPILPFPVLNFQLLSRLISDSFVGGT